ncbi:MAG: DegV family protein [Clostridia bacterium]|nr:DegV family protein [Clostridia bacterium]
MNIKITADSTCDLSKELIEKYEIEIIPLYVVVDGKAYKDTVEIQQTDIFNYVDNEVSKGAKMPSSSAVNSEDYADYFAKYASDYDAVIHISLSSDLSSTGQNARIAASEFNNVYVVDSKNLSTGSGLICIKARELANEGLSATEIVEKLDELTSKVDASFVIDRMDYLQKGGRCSAVLAIAAKLAKIKPMIQVKDGKMGVGKKYMGTFQFALKKYVADKLSQRDDIDYSRIFITSGYCKKETYDLVEEEVKKYADFKEINRTYAGCTVCTHCGPETMGILFMTK